MTISTGALGGLAGDTTPTAGSNQAVAPVDMAYLIRQSNLIEGIDDGLQDARSMGAWAWLSNQIRISEPILLDLHRGITIDQLSRAESGHYRTVGVTVGGRVCPPAINVPYLITDWLQNMAFYSDHTPKELHVEFEKIHPFIDGNGRTGRMLMWWHELKLGQQPTLILNDKKGDYYEWFR